MCEIFEKLKKKFFLGKQCFLSILRQNRVKKKYFFSVTIFEKILRNYFENFFENFFETFFSAQNNTITPKKMSLRNISSNTLLTFIFLNLDTNVLRSAFSVRVTSLLGAGKMQCPSVRPSCPSVRNVHVDLGNICTLTISMMLSPNPVIFFSKKFSFSSYIANNANLLKFQT